MIQVNIHHAKTQLSKLIQKVLEGEEVIIAKDNKPVVKLTQIMQVPQLRKIGSAQGEIQISENFEEALDDFAEYQD